MSSKTGIIADIGATNARFGLVKDGILEGIEVLKCADFEGPAQAAKAYLAGQDGKTPVAGAFAVAAPLDGSDRVIMVNHPWSFSISGVQQALGLETFSVLNDFEALAQGVPYLQERDFYRIGTARSQKDKPIAIIGPGTGLGVAGIAFGSDGTPIIMPTEGGHVTMPAATEREFAIFDWLKKNKYSHISAERVISGKGLVNLYHAICGVEGKTFLPDRTAQEITESALSGQCAICREALDLFCHFLGVIAGNLALSYGAFGGVYIAGGVVPKLGEVFFRQSRFYESFLAKGRFRAYMERVPVGIITHPFPGMEGLRKALGRG